MTIKIPQTTAALIGALFTKGDYANISEMLCGNNSKRQTIRTAIINGFGDQSVVTEIVKYFSNKNKVNKKLQLA